VAVVLLPSILAAQADGRRRIEVGAETLGDALRSLPIADLIFDESGALRRLVNVYVDGGDAPALDEPVGPDTEIRIVAAIAGGAPGR
jgi:hypothetical protein